MEKRICKHCGKSLVAFGINRINGKSYQEDWKTRAYHKKCFKIIEDNKRYQPKHKQ